ncbi:hypothetical protein [Cellulomonas wangsupingiae]|uniref:hypothetical protein n=1 Tax=Cellulomonas wangsupingiae TaxID=2968085 RepID=UPI001D0DC5FF|nr:hypothetical protein [Cellulomonas wangsupingiae]MCM0640047.1 hypothetical protein [Cellulomonas wangsupingiae]
MALTGAPTAPPHEQVPDGAGRGGAPAVMVRMRVALLRHALRDTDRAFWIWFAGGCGLLLALGTVVACALDPDLGAALLAAWMLGWVVGPLVSGGDEALRAEMFVATGLSRWRLGWALLTSSVVGVAPVVSAVAVLGVVAVGVRGGVLATLLAVVAAAAQLAVLLSVSRVAVGVVGVLVRYRAGAVLAGAVTGLALALPSQGWALVAALAARDATQALAVATRVAPSGWGLAAAEAAGRGDWALAVGAVVALLALAASTFALWCVLLQGRTTRRAAAIRPRRLLSARGPAGATVRAHLRSSARDLVQVNRFAFALAYGLFFCALPLLVGWTGMLPWAGAVFVVMAAMVWSNQYGRDGTALWLQLVTPGARRIDLLARQGTFLLATGPLALVLTAGLVAAAGTPVSTWPYLAAALAAALGAGTGVTAAMSVLAAVPTTDPHRRGGDVLASGGDARETGTTYLTMALVVGLTLPALLVARLAGWWGAVAGVATGALCCYLLTRVALRHLDEQGVELLALLRHGRRPTVGAPGAVPGRRPVELTGREQSVVLGAGILGTLMLFPQGIVPAVILRGGDPTTRSWFLALHVPAAWAWPVVTVMITLGATLYCVSVWWYRRATTAARSPAVPVRADA